MQISVERLNAYANGLRRWTMIIYSRSTAKITCAGARDVQDFATVVVFTAEDTPARLLDVLSL